MPNRQLSWILEREARSHAVIPVCGKEHVIDDACYVNRGSSLHTYRNIKRLVYCRYGNWKAKSNILSVGPSKCSSLTKGLNAQNIRICFHIGSTLTFLYFNLYLNTAYAAHCVYFNMIRQGYCLVFLQMNKHEQFYSILL